MICHHCIRTYAWRFSFLTTVPQVTMSKSSPYRTWCWKPETKNHHLGEIFMFTSILFCTSCEACHTTERHPYEEATWVASSTTNPRLITVWNLDGLCWSISRHNTRGGHCGPLWKIDPVLLSGTTPSTRTWLPRNHLKTFHHENWSCSTAQMLQSTTLWQTVLDHHMTCYFVILWCNTLKFQLGRLVHTHPIVLGHLGTL